MLDDVLSTVQGDAWLTPTALPGWTVRDVVSHIIGRSRCVDRPRTAGDGDRRARTGHVRPRSARSTNAGWRAAAPTRAADHRDVPGDHLQPASRCSAT
ncbi:hypothetical protein GS584_15645 [Rhodococcus hoagii]|nr:hypothetical protein [Prescottella equi]